MATWPWQNSKIKDNKRKKCLNAFANHFTVSLMQLMQAQHSSSLTASLTMLFLAPVPFREMAHPCASEHGDFPAANMTQFVRLGLVPEKKLRKLRAEAVDLGDGARTPKMIGLEAQALFRRSYAKLCEANHLLSSSITQRVSIAISRNAWHLLRICERVSQRNELLGASIFKCLTQA